MAKYHKNTLPTSTHQIPQMLLKPDETLLGRYLDILHHTLEVVDHLWDERQPIGGSGAQRAHPGGLGLG